MRSFFMILFTSGCSFTYGEELGDRQFAWPFVLGKLLNCDVINKGICSGSNDYIIRTTMEFISKAINDNINIEDILIILGFTTENRKECWSNVYKKYIQIKVGREFGIVDKNVPRIIPYKDIKNHKSVKKILDSIIDKYLDNFESDDYFNMCIKMNQMILMHFYLNSLKIKHLFFNSLHDCELKLGNDYTESRESYIIIKQLFDSIFRNNKNYISEFTMDEFCNDYPRAKLNHPLEEGHKAWAEFLYRRISEL